MPALREAELFTTAGGHPGVVEPLPDRIRVPYADPALPPHRLMRNGSRQIVPVTYRPC
jgi:hypothetical protein